MIKREKKTKLRGSVLLTVVCVMSLLIVFLFGTLTLATAANNRAHVNYSSAQTDVTSRIVVDSAVRAIAANNDYGSFIGKIGEKEKKEVNVTLGDGVPNRGRYGDIAPVTIEWAGTKDFYDPINNKWTNGGVLKFTSTVSMGGVNSTTSAYVVKQPAGTSSTGKGAGFVTIAGTNLTTQSNLFGGSYINIPKDTGLKELDYTYRSREYQEEHWENKGEEAIFSTYDPVYYRHFAPYDGSSDTAFTLGDHGGASLESDLFVNNNMLLHVWDKIVFPNTSTGISVWGDWIIKGTTTKYFASDNVRKPKDENGNEIKIKFNEIPYIYVDGNISCGESTDVKIGDTDNPFPLNIFCGSINVTQPKIAADLYCMNPDETSSLGGVGSTNLYAWTHSVLEKTNVSEVDSANIYSKGNLILKQITVDGDVCVEGDLTIKNNVVINGNIVVGGKLTIEDSGFAPAAGKKIFYRKDISDVPSVTSIKDNKNFKEVPLIVENEEIQCLEYTIDVAPKDKYVGLLGEEIDKWQVESNGLRVIYYKWRKGYHPEDGKYTDAAWTDKGDLINHIDTSEAYINSKYGSNKYWATFKYVPNEDGSKGDLLEDFINAHPGYNYSDSSDSIVYDKDGNLVPFGSNIKSASDIYKDLSEYKEDIYPECAERKVILNLEEKGGKLVPKDEASDAQIVKTFDQILASAANPYKTLPSGLAEAVVKYEKNELPVFNGFEDIANRSKKYLTVLNEDGTYDSNNIKDLKSSDTFLDVFQNGHSLLIIEEDCVIDIAAAPSARHHILIKPKQNDTTLNIIIKNLNLKNGTSIILDDSSANNAVNFYISGTLKLETSTLMTTTKYMKFLNKAKGKSIGYNSSVADFNIEDAGKPNINIYGGEGSYMYTNGASYIAANITSEHLTFASDGNNPLITPDAASYNISEIYYNDFPLTLGQGSIFGCLNAKEVKSANLFNVIYVTDSGTDPPAPSSSGFDYRVLYYDEY